MSRQISELQELPLRDQWPSEETDFTPWLAENISYLSEILDIDLEVQDTEANVGGYYADIYATDIEEERDIIVENQYNSSDHKHLGQSIVYAGGFDADIILWIAEEFNDPHIDAIQWFNNRTGDQTGFFAVEVSLVQIEESPVAPRFDIVERPSSWNAITGNLNDTEREHRRFWQHFEQRLEKYGRNEYAMNRTVTSASYVTKRFEEGYVRLSATVHDDLYCMVRIEDKSGEFAGLEQEEINDSLRSVYSEMGESAISLSEIENIDWESNPGQLYDKIVLHYSNSVDRSDEEMWPKYHDWMIDVTILFDRLLADRL